MRIILTLTLTLAGLLPAQGSAALVRGVAPDGSGDYATIQAAIDASDSADVVELLDGTYRGEGNRNLDFGGRAITLRSRSGDPQQCIIDCEGDSAGYEEARRGLFFQSGEDTTSVVRGLTITNGISGGD